MTSISEAGIKLNDDLCGIKLIVRPRRSVLYLPAINERAIAKAQILSADVIIFDLEDAVAPAQKSAARELLASKLAEGDYGSRELVLRVNGIDTEWFFQDIALAARLPIHGIALPKVESAAEIDSLLQALDSAGDERQMGGQLGLWPMIETPTGVFNAREIASASSQIECLMMGTSDLSKELCLPASNDRLGLLYSLSQCVLAAREAKVDVLDGVCLDLADDSVLTLQVKQGKALGFTGKTLIHPKQLEICNQVFGVNSEQISRAEKIIEAWAKAEREGLGVAVVNGQLVESLHVEDARRVLGLSKAIAERSY